MQTLERGTLTANLRSSAKNYLIFDKLYIEISMLAILKKDNNVVIFPTI